MRLVWKMPRGVSCHRGLDPPWNSWSSKQSWTNKDSKTVSLGTQCFGPVLAQKSTEASQKLRGSSVEAEPCLPHLPWTGAQSPILFYTIKVNQFLSKVYSTYNLHELLFAEAEAESTYQSSAEAKTVVAEVAQKTARKTCRSRNKLYRVLGTAQLLFLDCCWTPHCLKILDYKDQSTIVLMVWEAFGSPGMACQKWDNTISFRPIYCNFNWSHDDK